MKKVLYGLILAGLALAGPVQAAQNLRQNPDGTADWVSSNSKDTTWVGRITLTLPFVLGAGGSGGVTYQFISPISNAKIVDLRIMKQGAGSSTGYQALATVQPLQNPPVALITPMQQMSSGWGGPTFATIFVGGDTNVSSYALTPISTITAGRFLNNTLQRGDVINVQVSGGGGTTATGMIILDIAPK